MATEHNFTEVQHLSNSQLSKLIPVGFITLRDRKGLYVYVSDIDALKSKFEEVNPYSSFKFEEGPCLYFYSISIANIDQNMIADVTFQDT